MKLDDEIAVLHLLELALALPDEERDAWLGAQAVAAPILQRVRTLLAAESGSGDFLETAAEPMLVLSTGLPIAGERLGPWQLLRELDAGGMGVVYLACRADGVYAQQVAIKLVRSDLALDPVRQADLLARFDTERRLLARLEHPNVVRVLDGGTTANGLPYLVMEYVDGLAIDVYCDRHGLDIDARVALLARVCDGVQAAHRHLIVHRDLKPQNILIAADGEPRLLDFGIARLLEDVRPSTTQTLLSAFTPAYASPEQVRGEPLTTASDVYALGVVLYELLTGIRPYLLEGSSAAQSERIISDTVPPALRKALALAELPQAERETRAARIGSDLERIVARALHKDPERRYGSAQALADDLRRQLAGQPVQAHPDSVAYRAGKFLRRHRIGSIAAALAILAILLASAEALRRAAQARQSAADMAQVNGFLVDMLKSSNPYESDTEITLGQALDEAAAKVDERFGKRPDLAVDIRYALAESMLGRYRLDAAETQLLRTLADSEATFGRSDTRSISALASLASLRKEQGRIAEAKALYQDALDRLRDSGQQALALHSSVLNDLGVLHLIQEEFDQAEPILQQALAVGDAARPPVTTEERGQTLGNLAHAARGRGDLDRADALYAEVQASFEQLYPNGSPYLAIVLNNRARVARARKQPEQALALLTEAVAMHRRSFPGDHVMLLVPMTNLARQSIDLGRVEMADEWATLAAAMADRLYARTEHHYHAQALTALAEVRLLQQRPVDAGDLLIRAQTSLSALETPQAGSQKYLDGVRDRLCAQDASAALPACSGKRS